MRPIRFSVGFLVTLLTVSFLCLTARPGFASNPDDRLTSAQTTAKAWLAQIDGKQYEQSYEAASRALQDKTKQSTWEMVLKTLREPWGPIVNRKESSHAFKPDGIEGAPGEFMVFNYITAFKNRPTVFEVVVLKWEDGKWLGAGYNAQQAPPPDGDQNNTALPPPSTEIHTDEHAKPESQSQSQ